LTPNIFAITSSASWRGHGAPACWPRISPNADTPNYKARDIEFGKRARGRGRAVGSRAGDDDGPAPRRNESQPAGGDLKYRIPFQLRSTEHGGNADRDGGVLENAVRYQASLMFINRHDQTPSETALTGQ